MSKNFWKEYIAYIKDNPKGYWFRARPYGWGWVPATREGWIIVGVFIGAMLANAWWLERQSLSEDEFILKLLLRTFALVVLLILISWRTGEKPRWMWHIPKEDEKKDTELEQ